MRTATKTHGMVALVAIALAWPAAAQAQQVCNINFDDPVALSRYTNFAWNTFTGSPVGDYEQTCNTYRGNVAPENYLHFHLSHEDLNIGGARWPGGSCACGHPNSNPANSWGRTLACTGGVPQGCDPVDHRFSARSVYTHLPDHLVWVTVPKRADGTVINQACSADGCVATKGETFIPRSIQVKWGKVDVMLRKIVMVWTDVPRGSGLPPLRVNVPTIQVSTMSNLGVGTWDLSGAGMVDGIRLGTTTGWPDIFGVDNISIDIQPIKGSLYAVQDNVLWRADDETGGYKSLGMGWSNTTSLLGLNGWLYIISNPNTLYRVDPMNGGWTAMGGSVWPGQSAMAAVGSTLYITSDGGLWKITDLTTGAYARVGTNAYNGSEPMAALGSSLYIIKDGYLNKVNPSSGASTRLGGQNGPAAWRWPPWARICTSSRGPSCARSPASRPAVPADWEPRISPTSRR